MTKPTEHSDSRKRITAHDLDPGPGFVTEQATIAATRAIEALGARAPKDCWGPGSEFDGATAESIRAELEEVANYYLYEKGGGAQLNVKDLSNGLSRIEVAAAALLHCLVTDRQSLLLIRRRLPKASPTDGQNLTGLALETELNQLIDLCGGAPRAADLWGRRPKRHIANAARRLVSVWIARTQKRWTKSFEPVALTGGYPGYAFQGINFVHIVLRAIDPELATGEVLSALKKMKF